jgi:hypothetical protein
MGGMVLQCNASLSVAVLIATVLFNTLYENVLCLLAAWFSW